MELDNFFTHLRQASLQLESTTAMTGGTPHGHLNSIFPNGNELLFSYKPVARIRILYELAPRLVFKLPRYIVV